MTISSNTNNLFVNMETATETATEIETATKIETEIQNYITQLNDVEKKILNTAHKMLGSSFDIVKSIGFLEWKNTKE